MGQNIDTAAPGGEPQSGIGFARQRKDGWLALETPLLNAEGTKAVVSDVRTVPMVFEGDELLLNLDTGAVGSLAVELIDAATGAPLPGFELGSAVPIVANSLHARAEWRDAKTGATSGDVSALAGKAVVLRFRATACRLFSFRFKRA